MAHIHVIDDDPETRRLIALALEEAGHTVLRCENGRKAIEYLAHEPADLLIMDVLMPEMDGIETLRAMRWLQPRPPVLAISGGGLADPRNYLGMAQAFGATATLRKPFRLSELVEMVATLLGVGSGEAAPGCADA